MLLDERYGCFIRDYPIDKRSIEMSDGVKETMCTRCDHRNVCKFKKDYLKALELCKDIPYDFAVSIVCKHCNYSNRKEK